MDVATGRTLKGVTAAERVEQRRHRLRESCLDLVGEAGVAAATVNAVCARAGLTKRYFYENYADRDALLLELISGLFDGISGDIVAGLAGLTPGREGVGERTRATARALLGRLDTDRRLARLYVEAPAEPVLNARRSQALVDFADLVAERVVGLDTERPEVRFAAAVVVSGVTDVLSRWLSGDPSWTHEALVAAIERLGVALLDL